VCKLIAEACLVKKKIRVAMVTGSFGNGHGGGSHAEEGFGRGAYELGIGVYRSSGDVFDQVGFEQDGFPTDVEIEESKTVVYQFIEFVRVSVGMKNCDTGAYWAEIARILWLLESHGQTRAGSCGGGD